MAILEQADLTEPKIHGPSAWTVTTPSTHLHGTSPRCQRRCGLAENVGSSGRQQSTDDGWASWAHRGRGMGHIPTVRRDEAPAKATTTPRLQPRTPACPVWLADRHPRSRPKPWSPGVSTTASEAVLNPGGGPGCTIIDSGEHQSRHHACSVVLIGRQTTDVRRACLLSSTPSRAGHAMRLSCPPARACSRCAHTPWRIVGCLSTVVLVMPTLPELRFPPNVQRAPSIPSLPRPPHTRPTAAHPCCSPALCDFASQPQYRLQPRQCAAGKLPCGNRRMPQARDQLTGGRGRAHRRPFAVQPTIAMPGRSRQGLAQPRRTDLPA